MAELSERYRERALHPARVEEARRSLLDNLSCSNLAEAFAGLADLNRVKILSILLEGEICVFDLAAVLGVSESAVSQHLRILRSLRWVKNRKAGRLVFYSLNDEHVRDLLDLGLRHSRGL